MRSRSFAQRALLGLFQISTALLVFAGFCAPSQAQNPVGTVTLTGSMLSVVSRATLLKHDDATASLPIVLSLKFAHPDAAQVYADAVSDPKSPLFRQFLTPEEIGERFGPAQSDYDAVVSYLKASGLTITRTPANRMSVSATGTVPQIEAAFGVKINVYQESSLDRFKRAGRNAPPLTFFANDRPAQLPASLAPMTQYVAGLENYVRPFPLLNRKAMRRAAGNLTPAQARTAYDTAPIYNAGMQGQNRTVAISSFDSYTAADFTDFISAFALPTPAGGAASNIITYIIDGGYTGTPQGEADLDPQMVVGQAPLSTILIYEGPETLTGLFDVLSQEVSDNTADICTESYGWGSPDGFNATTLATAHNYHTMMTMQGQTYLAASGDSGSTFEADIYPVSDPDVLDVGGTVLTVSASNTISSEIGWGGTHSATTFGSGGGYSASSGFALPAYQVGRGVPTNIAYRLIPDIASNAAANNTYMALTGPYYFYYLGIELSADGTSNASPITAGELALVEQYLIANGDLTANGAGKYRLGRLNDTLYSFNGRNDVFYDVTSGTNGGYSCTAFWDFVTGWGSLDFYNLAAALAAPLAVSVTPQGPTINENTTLQLTATVTGSNVTTVTWAVTSGPGSVSSSGLYTAPATVTVPTTAVVTATSTINTATAVTGSTTITIEPPVSQVNISGTITLQGAVSTGLAQSITFQIQPTSNLTSITTQTVTLSATGGYTLTGLMPGTYNLGIKGSKWLEATVLGVTATSNATGVNATLLPGDIDGNNVVDLRDFNLLSEAFDSTPSSTNWNANADLDCNNVVDLRDFNLLAANFGKTGQTLP